MAWRTQQHADAGEGEWEPFETRQNDEGTVFRIRTNADRTLTGSRHDGEA